MTILYDLDVLNARHRTGFVRGPVRAIEAVCSGHWFDGAVYTPDLDAVRECLPHQWRKAFDRAGGFWFSKHRPDAPAELILRDASRRRIANLIATPKRY